MRHLLSDFELIGKYAGVQLSVPPSVVLTTEVFDRFLEQNHLRDFALGSADDEAIRRRFLEAEFPEDVVRDLASFLELIRYPLAVRSSSLLEDSQYQPLAGVYETYMLPNNHARQSVRLGQLQAAVKRVYASTFSQYAKNYFNATPYRTEEEKMAVIVQKLVGPRTATASIRTWRAWPARTTSIRPVPWRRRMVSPPWRWGWAA